jgi:1-acyl-sn-glycerol-3-phosphate acyltransferase
MTRAEVLKAIEECERRGAFDTHVDPIPREIVIPVTENYHYPNNRTFFEKLSFGLKRIFIVNPFTLYQNWFVMKTKVKGRKNLCGLNAAVLTCNHITKFDCLAVRYGAAGHRVFTVAAPFNNMKGFLGDMMRAGDMIPMSESIHGMAKFNRAVADVLERRKNFLLIYPEASMWWHYKKPRPYKDGAFVIAEKFKVPVVPLFITYRESGKKDIEGQPVPYMTLHIMPPIYSNPARTRLENIEAMKNAAYDACRRVYEEVYGEPLTYACDNNNGNNSNISIS